MSAGLWKVVAHNEKADPGFIYGTYDPVVITLQLSPLPLSLAHNSDLRDSVDNLVLNTRRQ